MAKAYTRRYGDIRTLLRRSLIPLTAIAMLVAVAGCQSSPAPTAPAAPTTAAASQAVAPATAAAPPAVAATTAPAAQAQPAAGKKLKIALANSYIGNKWRIEMANVFRAALDMEPYKSEVDGSIYSSGNDVSKQSQQLSNLISQKVDAIVLNAASPTGLNGIVEQAAQRGILVVSFDNTVTTPAALKVNTDQFKFGAQLAQFLADKMGGKGNVIMVTGVAGTTVDEQRNAGADSVWAKYPDIKVVNRFTGMWDSSVAERNAAGVLPSLPKIDGIWCQGGTDGVIKAFIAAGRPVPVVAGEAENGFRKFMLGDYMGQPKITAMSIGQPPFLSVVSLELARAILQNRYPKKDIEIPFPYVTTDTVKSGETVFPELEDSFFTDFTDSGDNATVQLCVDAGLSGTACDGSLKVNLPKP
ncbi:MAG TPA: sugar ABC transporter substrate-binding protein [Chloroflexota bacterium]|nr:sugar ABC transporter substrate-binding protein [Chloroflexota bacterium]